VNQELLTQNYLSVMARIRAAAQRCGRETAAVTLLAVSKGQPLELVQSFQRLLEERKADLHLGENYVQEARTKAMALQGPFELHLIGRLQESNAKAAAKIFSLIESVHSCKIAAALNNEAAKLKKSLPILLQVNISNDQAKAGFAPDELREFMRRDLPGLKNLALRGFMTITRDYEKAEQARPDFKALAALGREIFSDKTLRGLFSSDCLDLSMGMSQDFEVAIEEGATIVRIGTALFGERSAK
jgi:hypothetical protein